MGKCQTGWEQQQARRHMHRWGLHAAVAAAAGLDSVMNKSHCSRVECSLLLYLLKTDDHGYHANAEMRRRRDETEYFRTHVASGVCVCCVKWCEYVKYVLTRQKPYKEN